MKKIKKTIIGLGMFMVAAFSKTIGLISNAVEFSPSNITTLYGPPPESISIGERIVRIVFAIAKPVIVLALIIVGIKAIIRMKNRSKSIEREKTEILDDKKVEDIEEKDKD